MKLMPILFTAIMSLSSSQLVANEFQSTQQTPAEMSTNNPVVVEEAQQPNSTLPKLENSQANDSTQKQITGNDAGGNKQVTIVDHNGNLKVIDKSSEQAQEPSMAEHLPASSLPPALPDAAKAAPNSKAMPKQPGKETLSTPLPSSAPLDSSATMPKPADAINSHK